MISKLKHVEFGADSVAHSIICLRKGEENAECRGVNNGYKQHCKKCGGDLFEEKLICDAEVKEEKALRGSNKYNKVVKCNYVLYEPLETTREETKKEYSKINRKIPAIPEQGQLFLNLIPI